MAAGTYAPDVDLRVVDSNGVPVSGGLVWTYLAGTTTPVATYTDVGLTTPNTNPIVASSAGRYVAFLTPGVSYKFIEETAATPPAHGSVIITRDNIGATPTAAGNIDITGLAGESLVAGQAVYLSDGSGSKTAGSWYKADTAQTYSSVAPQIGMVPSSISSGASGTIRLLGQVPGLTVSVGSAYYVSTSGAITATPPVGNRRFLGVADSTTTLILTPNPIQPIQPWINDFRLTLTSGTPVTIADVTAAGTLYASPFTGNRIDLPDSAGNPIRVTSAEFSLVLAATSGKPYDVFVYNNGGVATLEILVWTNDTTRATALVRTTTGRLYKSGDLTRLYLGSFYATGANVTEDSFAKRNLWNYYNRVPRVMRVLEATDSWSYATNTWRQARATATNQVEFMLGVAEMMVEGTVSANASDNAVGAAEFSSIGEDSTTTPDTGCLNGTKPGTNTGSSGSVIANLKKYPAVGRHVWVWLEKGNGTGTVTWYGDNAGDGTQSGIHGVIQG